MVRLQHRAERQGDTDTTSDDLVEMPGRNPPARAMKGDVTVRQDCAAPEIAGGHARQAEVSTPLELGPYRANLGRTQCLLKTADTVHKRAHLVRIGGEAVIRPW